MIACLDSMQMMNGVQKYDGDLAQKTVAYTGEQKFKRYIDFLLENLD